jgi:hypothetical protein
MIETDILVIDGSAGGILTATTAKKSIQTRRSSW